MDQIDHIVVDVEVQRTIEETPGGWNTTDLLGVAVACVWEYRTKRMRVYGPDDLDALRRRLLQADRISGYNIWKFDFPVIWGLSKSDWEANSERDVGGRYIPKLTLLPKTNDLLRRIWQAKGLDPNTFTSKHGGVGLDTVASATLGIGKVGHGEAAPKWYQAGLIQKVCNYCADDVALERDLSDFIDKYGYVIAHGEQLKIPPWKPGQL